MTPANYTAQAQAIAGSNFGGLPDSRIDLQPMMGAEFAALNGTVTLTVGTPDSATIAWQPIKKKYRIIGARAIGQGSYTGGTVQIYNGTNAITGTIAAAASGTITNATSVSPTYSILNPGDVLKAVVAKTTGGALLMDVSVLVDMVPIGND